MKQMLWIGCLEDDDELNNKVEKGYELASAQTSQKNLLNGIEKISGCGFDSINGSIVPPYPIYRDKKIPEINWQHREDSYDVSVGYRNIKYINRIFCRNAMLRSAKKWIQSRYEHGELTVFAYSMRSPTMATACYIKRKIPKAKIYLIITDLPQFMDLGQNKFKAFLKRIDWLSIKKYQHKFDGFILYASEMAKFLKISDEKWLLMEGSYDLKDMYSVNPKKESPVKAIMYSGKLDKEYGINMLVDAFMEMTEQNLELWLTGGGNAVEYIRECARIDSRIKFYGFLKSREDVLRLQVKATMLINMRLPSEPASDYCFPSKLFEYMVTGVPVLSFPLRGIPEEYMQYLITIDDESAFGIQKSIRRVLKMPEDERIFFGAEARNFIINYKSSDKQCKRILEFVSRNA